MNILHIAEGWYNSFLDRAHLLDPEIRELGDIRLSACSNCPIRTENRCDDTKTHINTWGTPFNGCGCYIDKKVLCKECTCPGGFW
jgi:hypothetical protein